MFRRIKNELDLQLMEKELQEIKVDSIVIARMKEIIFTLDDAYGSNRSSRDMGGYIFFFSDEESYTNSFSQILAFYRLGMKDYEYSEKIDNTNADSQWWEELYMLSSDDALVFIHPKGV